MDVWSRDRLTRTKKEEEKDIVVAVDCSKKPPGDRQSGRSGEISVFPLTLLIMDVPRLSYYFPYDCGYESLMKNLKAFQKSQLIYEFGILIQPLEELARAKQVPSLNDYRIAIAKAQAGDGAWRQQVKAFTTFAPDIFFSQEYQDISHVPERCWGALKGIINDPVLQNNPNQLKGRVEQEVANVRERFFEYIDRIPIEWE
ncbi:MAG TPA: hypothetical protein VJ044_14825, partial [Candidatus Hodarchaeales archaeon]|nr:hypothetical protein [Candidatus Hodarchaeales archaeon]